MLTKQSIAINFAGGVDTKTDPWQLNLENFKSLENSVFTTGKRLTKRNGFAALTALPSSATSLSTFNGDLTAIGSGILAYSTSNASWVEKGEITPLSLSTLPLIRNNLNQIQADAAVSISGLVCTAYSELNDSTVTYKYVVADSVTGQNIIAPQILAANATYGTPKVYLLGNYFIIIYSTLVSSAYHLVYIAVSIMNPSQVTAPATITTSYTPATSVAFDAVSFNNNLYVAWNGASTSGIKAATISSTAPGSANPVSGTVVIDASHVGTILSLCVDMKMSVVWISYYNSGTSTGYTAAVAPNLVKLASFPAEIITTGTVLNLSSSAQNGICTIFYEVSNTASGIQTNYVARVTVIQATAVVSSPRIVVRSLGLASKSFIIDGIIYFLGAYSSDFQSTYFLINGSLSTSAAPVITAKLAYENGGGYLAFGLPSATVQGTTVTIAYLYKDLVQALANTNSSGTTVAGGIYSQTGINQVQFNFDIENISSAEIGLNLNLSGGYLMAYDGYSLAEQGFHLWPDSIQLDPSSSGGFLTAQTYFYQVTYEWTDNQGNAFRSAGSIPLSTATTGTTSSVTLTIPTLRVTQKIANPVKLVVYRWSTANQLFYQITSITAPILNDTTIDSIDYLDTQADSDIIGNNILYTTGGVIEDIGGPATSNITLFDDRLWLVDSEDQNLLWFSKQVIEATPVEMSDLLTVYVNPNISSTGPTGPITALAPMDDKLIIFKRNALNYIINGSGPDNTGANNGYSQPTFVTSMVGCTNQNSIVFQPEGLMFEYYSEAGAQIWIVTRGLATQYIGAPVEALTKNARVVSAIAVPGTNQVRFDLSSGIRLMYDYFYSQWGIHTNTSISSTLYQDLHTYLTPQGQVLQESEGLYTDASNPVLLSFETAWINLASVQGFERFYYFYFLGEYLSPHLLNVGLSYDYNDSVFQNVLIMPDNFSDATPSAFGDQPAPFGSPASVEQWKIHAQLQKCQSFKITVQEVFDSTLGASPGAGLSLSGLNVIAAIKRGSRPIRSANTAGG